MISVDSVIEDLEEVHTPEDLQVALLALIQRAAASAGTGLWDLEAGRAGRQVQALLDLEAIWHSLMVANSRSNPGYELQDIPLGQKRVHERVQRTLKLLQRAVSVGGGQ